MKLTVIISRRKSAVAAVLTLLIIAGAATSARSGKPLQTATPIKHVIVIFDENRSFDHYFGVYPRAANPPDEPPFTARPDTPQVAGLSGSLLTDNPNLVNPFLLDRAQANTCDQNHGYSSEQLAFDSG
jgi:phospholipase C